MPKQKVNSSVSCDYFNCLSCIFSKMLWFLSTNNETKLSTILKIKFYKKLNINSSKDTISFKWIWTYNIEMLLAKKIKENEYQSKNNKIIDVQVSDAV